MLFGLDNYHENVKGQVGAARPFSEITIVHLDPGGTVQLPPIDAVIFHHEAELAFVIGKPGKDITETAALDHVFGYTCIIDVSARGLGGGACSLSTNLPTRSVRWGRG